MIKVKVTTRSPLIPLIKMTPGSRGIIGDFHFFVDQDVSDPDWWVVADGLPHAESASISKKNTILITQETEVVKTYEQEYVDQFNWIITCQKTLSHPRKIFTQQAHQSYLFMHRRKPGQSVEEYQSEFKSYDELNAIKHIPKSKILSAVTSNKLRTTGAIARYKFTVALKERLGDIFDIYSNKAGDFGPDTKTSTLKWDAVAPYKYLLSIENSYVPHWWTSHLFDAWIAGAYPFFYGHPSIFDYFPKNSLTLIDINDIEKSVGIIEKAIRENYFEKYQKEIWEARDLVLNKYNMFQMLADVISTLPSDPHSEIVNLQPETNRILARKQKAIRIINQMPFVRNIAKMLYHLYRYLRYGEKHKNKNHARHTTDKNSR